MKLSEMPERVVFDLEWNYPHTRYREEQNGTRLSGEIIQIGAVKIDAEAGITDRYNAIIRPQYYRKMRKDITELTDITNEDLAGGRPFPEVVREFLDWCGEEWVFFSWSPSDIYMIEENMLFYGMEVDGLPDCYDMQVMFDDQITMEGRDYALSYAMWKLGIKPEQSHNALNDAINTAEVMKHLDFSEDLAEYIV
ncbi:MAG: exonuclease domain-containing protein [Mogibacterium sp.]|nr:exonuclease domain-containing protein [Mogibacterium sp.]